MIAIETDDALPVGAWSHLTLTYDGSSRAAGLKLYVNGAPATTHVEHDHLTRTILPFSTGDVFDPFQGLAFGTRFREKAPVGSGIDELKLFNRDLTPVEVAFLQDEQRAVTRPASELAELLVATDAKVQTARKSLTAARAKENELATAMPQVLVMGDAPQPIPTFVLNRGVYSALGDRVYPHGLDAVLKWDEQLPQNRLGLAQWLFDRAQSAHGARVREPHLAAALRPRHRRDRRGLRFAGLDPDASRAARLARRGVRRVRLGRQSAAQAHRDVGRVPPELGRERRRTRARCA